MPLNTLDVFILTAESFDREGCNHLRFYGVADRGTRVEILVDNIRPVFFVPHDQLLPKTIVVDERRPLALRDMMHTPVDALYFKTHQACRQAAAAMDAQNLPTYETDVGPWERYLLERFIHGQVRVEGEFLTKGRCFFVRNPRMAPCTVTPQLCLASVDIETDMKNDRLYSIAVDSVGPRGQDQVVFMVAEKGMPQGSCPDWLGFHPDERTLLKAFLDWFEALDPDVIIGWHVIGFDLQFLERACRRLDLKLAIGRDRRTARVYQNAIKRWIGEVPGRVVLDGPVLLRGAFYSFEDFRLDTVARELLGEGKLIHSQRDKVAEIDRLYAHDKVALAEYNLQDCRLVQQIFKITSLMDLYVRRVQISGLLLDHIGRSAAAFDHFFLPRLHREGHVAINTRHVVQRGHSAGGWVMEPTVGVHKQVAVFDFKSLYPSIIRTFRIDPLSRLYADRDAILTPEGFRFSHSRHILPNYIERLMQKRAEAKNNNDPHLAQAIKILMNSFYGVMGSYGCRFYHPDLPSAITSTGQWLLRECRRLLEQKGYEVLYGDTDSLFVQLPDAEGRNARETGESLAEELNVYWRKRLHQEFGVESRLEMEYEKCYHRFVLPPARGRESGAKKRYVGLRFESGSQGNREILEFVGMEYVRSDWTPLAKEFQYGLYWRLLHEEDIGDWLRGMVADVKAGLLDEKLVYHKRLRKDHSEYTKNVPPQVQAVRKLPKPGRDVHYLVTVDGPVPIQLDPQRIDYRHYIDKQLKPIADTVLGLVGQSFDGFVGSQQRQLF